MESWIELHWGFSLVSEIGEENSKGAAVIITGHRI